MTVLSELRFVGYILKQPEILPLNLLTIFNPNKETARTALVNQHTVQCK